MNANHLTSNTATGAFDGAQRLRPASVLPGVLLTGAIAGAAFAARGLPGLSMFSPMILAMAAGMFIRNAFGAPERMRYGVLFAMRRILRLAIVLLGLQLTFAQVVSVGASGVISVLSNVMPAEVTQMVRLALDGKWAEARAIHARVYPLVKSLFLDGNPAGVKAAMNLLGRDSGELRLPVVEASEPTRKLIAENVRKLGLLK